MLGVLAAAISTSLVSVFAADKAEDPDTPRDTFNFLLENDEVAGTDRHYTNGVEFSYFSAPLQRWQAYRFSIALGQQTRTPNDTDTTLPVPGDRPYAAWLYGGVSLVIDHGNQLDTVTINIGTTGPDAQGEDVQNGFHRLIDSDRSNGWSKQIGNEFGYQLMFEHRWRGLLQTEDGGLGVDLSPYIGGSLGNIQQYANAGLMLRFGNGLGTDYGVPRIRPSMPGSAYFERTDGFSWYLFAGADGRYVDRNIFLDGTPGSLSVEKKNWVCDLQADVAVTFRRLPSHTPMCIARRS